MRVLLAVDRIGALPAAEVAQALIQGWRSERDDELRALPLSDGSAGLLGVLGDAEREVAYVPGPLGGQVPVGLAHRGSTWWVDADDVLGARLVPGREVESLQRGSSAGLGVLLARLVAAGARRIVLGLGPGAVHDAGAGLVRALARGAGAPGGPVGVARAAAGSGEARDGTQQARDGSEEGRDGIGPAAPTPDEVRTAADRLAGTAVVLALATDEPLTGLHGTGAMLSERFGLAPARAQDLDRATGAAADLVLARAEGASAHRALPLAAAASPAAHGHAHSHAHDPRPGRLTTRTDGTGAGGGVALALRALGARSFDGADVVAGELGLAAALDELGGAGLVVSAATEVGPDEARRSVLATVGRAAAERALPVLAVGRRVSASRRELAPSGISASAALVRGRHPDEPPAADDPAALRAALVERGVRLARTWSTA